MNDIEVAERALRKAVAADYNKWLKVVKMGFKGTKGLSKIPTDWIERQRGICVDICKRSEIQ